MKRATQFFTIYILFLSLIPCSDGGSGIVEIAMHLFGVTHQEYSDHEQHSNTCGDDHCSTFCICSCCSSAVDFPAKLPLLFKSPAPLPGTTPSFFSNIIHSSFTFPVWQPPKYG